MIPASSMRRTRSVMAGVDRPTRRPSSANDKRAFCCKSSRMLHPRSSSSLWGLANDMEAYLLLNDRKVIDDDCPHMHKSINVRPVLFGCPNLPNPPRL